MVNLNTQASVLNLWMVFCMGKDFLFKSILTGCVTCKGQPCCKGNWDAMDRYSKPSSNDGEPLHDLPAELPSCYEPKRSQAIAYCQRA